jgi:acetoin utilization protein AcuC
VRAVAGLSVLGAAGARASAQAHMSHGACLYHGEALGRYGFPFGHPLGVDRQGAFLREAQRQGLERLAQAFPPRVAAREAIERFHTAAYVDRVRNAVVGSALDGVARVMRGECSRTFQPIGGLHHASRGSAAGFCVFNDLGVAIETLRREHGVRRVGYVDIDVHHGDGVFYPFEEDPDLIFADIHEDGRYLYPGTGTAHETGRGAAAGTKLNIPVPPGADNSVFDAEWPRVMAHLRKFEPEFILLQAGADSIEGDPITHMRYTADTHQRAARDLSQLADALGHGRVLGTGGGGYNRINLARAWSGVVQGLL